MDGLTDTPPDWQAGGQGGRLACAGFIELQMLGMQNGKLYCQALSCLFPKETVIQLSRFLDWPGLVGARLLRTRVVFSTVLKRSLMEVCF
jgi:hypothetical protein